MVIVTPAAVEMTDAEFASCLGWMGELFLRGGKFAVLLDSRHSLGPAERTPSGGRVFPFAGGSLGP